MKVEHISFITKDLIILFPFEGQFDFQKDLKKVTTDILFKFFKNTQTLLYPSLSAKFYVMNYFEKVSF